MSARQSPRLAVLYPRGLVGENAGLLDLHVRSLEQLLEPLGWQVDARMQLDPGFAAAALGADLAVVQMMSAAEVEGVIRCRRERGRPTIFEITDNPVGVGGWLPSTHAAHSPLARQAVLYYAHLSDALQMLVPALAELFAAVNPRRIVLRPYVPVPAAAPIKPPGFVFGWSGSRSHRESLAAAAPAIVEMCRRHPDATFAFMGDRAMFGELFSALDPRQTKVEPFSAQAGHLRFVGGLHVGLAPMLLTPFNATRSDTRVCVYAGHRVALVLQDAPAHRPHAEHARIYRTPTELLAILEDLHGDRGRLDALAGRARDWAVRERSANVLAEERDRAYRGLLDGSPAAGPAAPRDTAGLAHRLAEAYASPDPAAALALCDELVAEAPGYDQAQLLALHCLERLGRDEEALDRAAALTPSPVYADLVAEVQARIAGRVRPHECDRHVAKIRSPFRRARLAADGRPAERSRAVLLHQPYDHFALMSTIARLHDADPSARELDELYERACMVAPADVPAHRRPARLAPFLPA